MWVSQLLSGSVLGITSNLGAGPWGSVDVLGDDYRGPLLGSDTRHPLGMGESRARSLWELLGSLRAATHLPPLWVLTAFPSVQGSWLSQGG